MFHPLICGASSHRDEDDENELWSSSPNSTPRKSRKNNKDTKNPYSNRGLDKFSALLSELEDKRQKIYLQTGSQDISLVRFMYKNNSTDCVPVVVKLRDKKEEPKEKPVVVETNDHQQPHVVDKHPMETFIEAKDVMKTISRSQTDSENTHENKKRRVLWNVELHKWRRPYYYLPAFFVLILLLLMFFGRSVSILFTCVGWYIVPTIQEGSSNRVMKKKDYVRKSSNKSEAVRSKHSSPVRDHHHRKN